MWRTSFNFFRQAGSPAIRKTAVGSVFAMTVTAMLIFVAPGLAVADDSYWVSTSGLDTNPGTKDAPFKTLGRAQEAVREALKGNDSANISVNIEPGRYRLENALKFSGKDSAKDGFRVTWRTAPGAGPGVKAEILGSVAVSGWTAHDPGNNVYKTHVEKAGSRQLFVNGSRAQRARTGKYPVGFLPLPDSPSGFTEAAEITGGIGYITSDINPGNWRDPAGWSNITGVEAVIATQWRMMRVPVEQVMDGIIPNTFMLKMQQPAWTNANLFLGSNGKPGVWSFWQVSWFENALEFLDEPGEWYLQPEASGSGTLYYKSQSGGGFGEATVELPVAEQLIVVKGMAGAPVKNITFSNLAFKFATWSAPSGGNGYVADQGGFFVVGPDFDVETGKAETGWRKPNRIGHVEEVVSTPGILSFEYASGIVLEGNLFEGLGAVGVAFEKGSRGNFIVGNEFKEISSAAIRLGGVSKADARPALGDGVFGNVIEKNFILNTGRDYYDAPGIIVGFTSNTKIARNEIDGTSWSGIAVGWGWGLLDSPPFPGVPNATAGQWGTFDDQQTINDGNEITQNWIRHFLQELWDGGAIYTTGQQARSSETALKIHLNAATGRGKKGNTRARGGGNTFYTDGGSRHVVIERNLSEDNPVGRTYFGPPPPAGDPLPYPVKPSEMNDVSYGSEIGGCRTYGDIDFKGNLWAEKGLSGIDPTLFVLFGEDELLGDKTGMKYIEHGFFNVCPVKIGGKWYPTNLTFEKNLPIIYEGDAAAKIRAGAGVPR